MEIEMKFMMKIMQSRFFCLLRSFIRPPMSCFIVYRQNKV